MGGTHYIEPAVEPEKTEEPVEVEPLEEDPGL